MKPDDTDQVSELLRKIRQMLGKGKRKRSKSMDHPPKFTEETEESGEPSGLQKEEGQ